MTKNYKQKVLVSIDTEGPAGKKPVDALIFGKTKSGKEYGIRYLMDLFDEYGAKGLFFVDFAEAWEYGEQKITEVTQCILDKGHNVGVHLHPDHMLDRNRRYLWQYSLDEQTEMILKCTELYKKIVGKSPLSFRAGRYGADNNTIKILEQQGYLYDMSEFYGNKYCKINPAPCFNRMVNIGSNNIIEVPVTSFRSFKCPLYTRFDKVDCSMDIHEFYRVINKAYNEQLVDVVSFFVHSFSLLDWRQNPDSPLFNKKLDINLKKQLEWIKNNEKMEFISESDLKNIDRHAGSVDTELDASKGLMAYYFFAKRALKVLKDRSKLNV